MPTSPVLRGELDRVIGYLREDIKASQEAIQVSRMEIKSDLKEGVGEIKGKLDQLSILVASNSNRITQLESTQGTVKNSTVVSVIAAFISALAAYFGLS